VLNLRFANAKGKQDRISETGFAEFFRSVFVVRGPFPGACIRVYPGNFCYYSTRFFATQRRKGVQQVMYLIR
jgi:hypothetical protein